MPSKDLAVRSTRPNRDPDQDHGAASRHYRVEALERRLFLSTAAAFAIQQTFAAGSQPRSVAVADVNADGNLDLILANAGNNTVGVFLGNGNGTFQPQRTFSTGTTPFCVAVADVNADGKPDLLVANNGGNSVSVLLGNGNGTFQPQQTLATGTSSRFIAVADVNGDGRPDLVVASYTSNTISVLLGNGNGTFQSQRTFSTGIKPSSVALVDLNSDGKPDLAIANKGSNSVSILLGNGDGTFQPQQTFATGSAPFSVAAGDLNQDGKIDLAVADEGTNAVSVLMGNGNGTFQTQQTYAAGMIPCAVAISDVNGDGNLDLAVANYTGNSASVLLGNGNGTFQAQYTFATGTSPFALSIADVNRDGLQDLLVANEGGNTVGVLLGSGNAAAVIPTPAHVVVVIEENQGYNNIMGNPAAPYINSLAQQGANFLSSHAVAHPSQPDYLALFSGSTQGVTDDTIPSSLFAGPDLASELLAARLSFTGYSEGLPAAGSLAVTAGPIDAAGNPVYARKHNPWSDFADVPASDNQPFSSFPQNFASLPTVSFVVPNLVDDMHDGTISQGDQWLQANLGAYAAWTQTHNSLLIVTWDEDSAEDTVNQIATLFFGQPVQDGTYGQNINHYNVLRTIEDMYHLPSLGLTGGAAAIQNVWRPTIVISATSDDVTLNQDSDHQHVDWTLGSVAGQVAISGPAGLTIDGNAVDDLITLDYSNGNPLPNTLHLNGTFTIIGVQGTNPLANGTLDIERSTVYISYSTLDPLSLIQGYLKNGYNNGAWNGTPTASTGVITSIPAAENAAQSTAIGYADSADGLIPGQPANTIELKYTLYGDTSLTGNVGFNDFTRLTQHNNQTSGGAWDTGDFNYDGSVNFSDFTLMTRTYNTSLGSQASPALSSTTIASTAAPAVASPTSQISGQTQVAQPEPAASAAEDYKPASKHTKNVSIPVGTSHGRRRSRRMLKLI